MSNASTTTFTSVSSPILFRLQDVNDERVIIDDHNSELLSDSSSISTLNSSSLAKRSYDAFNVKTLSFIEWLHYKRETFQRKRYILSDSEYDDLFLALTNKTILKSRFDLKWATTLISSSNLLIQSEQTEIGLDYFIVKPKKQKKNAIIFNSKTYVKLVKISQIESIIRNTHQSNHAGIQATHNSIKKEYYGITRDIITEFIERCQTCRDTKAVPNKRYRPLIPIISKRTFQHIVIDLIDFSHSPAGDDNEYKYIIHAIDHFSSFRYAEAITEKTAKNVFSFLRRLFSIISYPQILQSDNGSEFRNSLVENYLSEYNVEYRHGKPYTPQTQGKIERANRTLKEMMNKFIKDSNHTLNWYDVLYECVRAINITVSSSTKKSPYELVYLQEPHKPSYAQHDDQSSSSNDDGMERNDIIFDNDTNNFIHNDNTNSINTTNNTNSNIITTNVSNPLLTLQTVVHQFRGDAISTYLHTRDMMKAKHDKPFMGKQHSIGDIVGVLVPKAYRRSEISKILPAAIIGYKEEGGFIYYLLGYNFKIVKGQYLQSEFIIINSSTYQCFVGITPEMKNDKTIFANWGVNELNPDEYLYLSLHEAYNHYIDLLQKPHSSQIQTNLDPIPTIIDNNNSINNIQSKSTIKVSRNASEIINTIQLNASNPERSPFISTNVDRKSSLQCCICDLPIEDSVEILTCKRCNRPMHHSSNCVYGLIQFVDEKTREIYCTMHCFKQWDKYEVEIVGEKGRNYLIRYNTDEIALKSKSSLKYAEYFKIVTIYNNRKVQIKRNNAITISENNNSIINNPSSINNSPLSLSSSSLLSHPINSSSPKRLCCVCKGELTQFNWKSCHNCGKEMHGKIICDRSAEIIDNDGIVYCSKACYDH